MLLIGLLLLTGLVSCDKDFLEIRPDKALVVPQNLSDFQALLDNVSNTTGSGIFNSSPGLNSIADGNFSTTNAALPIIEKNTYLWAPDLYGGATSKDWNDPYQQVFYANVVLDGLEKLVPDDQEKSSYNQVKGTALFFRAFAFYNLLQQFCSVYIPAGNNTEMGIPILLKSDVNQHYSRGTLAQSYQQVLKDLLAAAALLPSQSELKTRPDQLAAKAMLSRVYLNMGAYPEALQYANEVLKVNGKLLDYNNLTANATNATNPFPKTVPLNNNPEVLFYSAMLSYSFTTSTLTSLDADLFKSYALTDLRRAVFYMDRGKEIVNFKGHYTGDTKPFTGLATDELYLIRAECYARAKDVDKAITELNALLINRYAKNNFSPLSAADPAAALALVLSERRKELVARGIQWGDLKRLNLDNNSAKKLTRTFAGQTYVLLPNDQKYVFPIPDNEIALSGIPQNPRD